MSKRNMEWKVGLFVVLGLVLAAIMVMRFSKGASLVSSTYKLNMKAANSGGIIEGAGVLMSGVRIGSVSEIKLRTNGIGVIMIADISGKVQIPQTAVFTIETVGFLGDRYVGVIPLPPEEGKPVAYLESGAEVVVGDPFEFTQVAQRASGLMEQVSGILRQLSNAVDRLDSSLLSRSSLSNLTETVANFNGLSRKSSSAMDKLNSFIDTNTPALSGSISNFTLFTEKLNRVTLELQETVATNRLAISAVVNKAGEATEKVNGILAGIERGEGLAGSLIKNEQVATYTAITLSNFMVLSSNINHKGLWGVIRKPKIKD